MKGGRFLCSRYGFSQPIINAHQNIPDEALKSLTFWSIFQAGCTRNTVIEMTSSTLKPAHSLRLLMVDVLIYRRNSRCIVAEPFFVRVYVRIIYCPLAIDTYADIKSGHSDKPQSYTHMDRNWWLDEP
jgi:hypothetical protein